MWHNSCSKNAWAIWQKSVSSFTQTWLHCYLPANAHSVGESFFYFNERVNLTIMFQMLKMYLEANNACKLTIQYLDPSHILVLNAFETQPHWPTLPMYCIYLYTLEKLVLFKCTIFLSREGFSSSVVQRRAVHCKHMIILRRDRHYVIFQMSIRLNFCRSVPLEFLRSFF